VVDSLVDGGGWKQENLLRAREGARGRFGYSLQHSPQLTRALASFRVNQQPRQQARALTYVGRAAHCRCLLYYEKKILFLN